MATPAVDNVAQPPPSSGSVSESSVAQSVAGGSTPLDNNTPRHSGHVSNAKNSRQNPQKSHKWKNNNYSLPPPTNSIVLKNLDYDISQITLEEVVRRVTGDRMGFVNITLVEDKATRSFRGMAFVNFHTTEDATAALAELSKMVINDRKVFAEYRRLKPGERESERKSQYDKRSKKFDHSADRQTFEKDIPISMDENGNALDKRAAFFAKRDTVKKADEQKRFDERVERSRERENTFRSLLLQYGEGEMEEEGTVKDLVFDASLTSYERKMVHQICSELGLGHISRFDDEGNRVLYVTKDPKRTIEWEQETNEAKTEARKQAQENRRKNKENNEWRKTEPTTSAGPITKEEKDGIHWFKPRSAMNGGQDKNEKASNGIRAPSYKVYIPSHKPTGPDGTTGFTSRVKKTLDSGDETIEDGSSAANGEGVDYDNTAKDDSEGKHDENGGEAVKGGKKSGNGSHKVLNPSVPAFSPSFSPSF